MLQRAAKNAYSWWWASHIRSKQSKWLDQNLHDMEEKVGYIVKIIDEDGDSFARRAEMYYRKRPEILNFVEDTFRNYRALAERYDHISRELQNANRTIANVYPERVQLAMDDEDGESFLGGLTGTPEEWSASSKDLPAAPKLPRALSMSRKAKQPSRMMSKKGLLKFNAIDDVKPFSSCSGLSKEEALGEIDELQKQILALQTEREFVKSSYENGAKRYWDIENQINEMQANVNSLQDEFGIGTIIEDNEARSLMASTALKSCHKTLERLQGQHEKSNKELAVESGKVQNLTMKFDTLVETLAASQELKQQKLPSKERKPPKPNMDSRKSEQQVGSTKQGRIDVESLRKQIKEELQVSSSATDLNMSELAEKVDELVEKIISLESAVLSQNTYVNRLKAEANELHEHLHKVEDEKESLIQDSENMNKKIRQLEEELQRVLNLNHKTNNHSNHLQTRIAEASCKLDDLAGKLINVLPEEETNTTSASGQEQLQVHKDLSANNSNSTVSSDRMAKDNLKKDGKEIQAHKDNLKKDGKEIQAHKDNLKKDGMEIQAHKDSLKKDGKEIQAHKDSLKKDGKEIQAHKDNLKKDGRDIQAHKDSLKKDGREIQAHKESLKKDGKEIQAHKESLKKDGKEIQAHKDSLKKDGKETQAHKESLKKDGKEIQAHKESLKKDGKEIQAHKDNLKKDGKEIQAHKDNLKKDGKEIQAHKDNLKKDGREIQAHKDNLKKDGREIQAHKDNLKKDGKEIQAHKDNLKKDGKEIQAHKDNLKKDGKEIQAHKDNLKKGGKEIQAHKDNLKKGGKEIQAHKDNLKKGGKEIQAHKDNLKKGGKEIQAHKDNLKKGGKEIQAHDAIPAGHSTLAISGDKSTEEKQMKDGNPEQGIQQYSRTQVEQDELVTKDDKPNWKELFLNGLDERDKVLIDEYTSVLVNYREVKNKLNEAEKKRRASQFQYVVQVKVLKNSNALKDAQIQSLQKKLSLLQENHLESPKSSESTVKASLDTTDVPHKLTLSELLDDSILKETASQEKSKGDPAGEETTSQEEIKSPSTKEDGEDPIPEVPIVEEPHSLSAIEEKIRTDIDDLLEENIQFWHRFSNAFQLIRKYETSVQDLHTELQDAREKAKQEGNNKPMSLFSAVRPIYRHLREILTELMLWLESNAVHKEDLQNRLLSLSNIEDEITRLSRAGPEGEEELGAYQAAKFQGEIQNMKQENKKVATQLQAGVELVHKLQDNITKTISKLDEEFGFKKDNSSSRSRIPLRSFLFGTKVKKQKPSLFACVSPALQRQYSDIVLPE
ncbi:PREDICTED: protein NETWORKED 2D-like [Ipomoea nil]|uniref:protein NETWORKED 2D-like n=1 Tax=Ipomoea nil TaxID=35883 RepID=UPI000901EB84|nr:PREDICTED: protein NETWORKED 2D-like [Ipomoea nil]